MSAESLHEISQIQKPDTAETIDFKMVTFSLGGKDYSIDIMKVKEISHATNFTYVPNSLPFVKGVYNLRGDIISIIDLRLMFNLPAPENTDKTQENLIILRLDEYQLGIIVDSIDKVVGITSASIQPPHPIFGDINIRFIKGVVENEGNLYVILDVEKIFGLNEDFKMINTSPRRGTNSHIEDSIYNQDKILTEKEQESNFIIETLRTFKKFIVSPVNREWFDKRFEQWLRMKGNDPASLQLQSENDANEFLSSFYSSGTGRFWDEALRNSFASILSDLNKKTLSVWNPGCGKGYETYSLASVLREKYPDVSIKIWASDNDLLSISNAPNLVCRKENLPSVMEPYTIETSTGLQFTEELKDLILFEYHDVMHPNSFIEVDIIVARDLISFLGENDQSRLITEFKNKLRPGGILVVGENEKIHDQGWEYIGDQNIAAYVNE